MQVHRPQTSILIAAVAIIPLLRTLWPATRCAKSVEACTPESVVRAAQPATQAANDETPISPSDAAELQRLLVQTPDDIHVRTSLLRYYFRLHIYDARRSARDQHILWLIRHRPEADILNRPEAYLDRILDRASYALAKQIWLQHLEVRDSNTAVLRNAACFFEHEDFDFSASLWLKCAAMDPENMCWIHDLGMAYFRRIAGCEPGGAEAKVWATKALNAFEKALGSARGEQRYELLRVAAWAAMYAGQMDKARNYALDLIDVAVEAAPHTVVDVGRLVHHGHLVLGHVALDEGRFEAASEHLLKAAKPPCTPALKSFGPNMSLALAMLKRNRPAPAIAYLQECAKFWKPDRIHRWIQDISEGRVPDFGANLRY